MVPIRTPRGAPPSAILKLRAALLRSWLLAGPRCQWAPVPFFGSSLPSAITLVRAGFDRIGSIRSSLPLTLSERPLYPIGKPIGAGSVQPLHLASSSHRDRSVPRRQACAVCDLKVGRRRRRRRLSAVPRSLPGAGRNPRPQAPTLTQPLAYLRTAAPYG